MSEMSQTKQWMIRLDTLIHRLDETSELHELMKAVFMVLHNMQQEAGD